jgi:hypothetical protein
LDFSEREVQIWQGNLKARGAWLDLRLQTGKALPQQGAQQE